MKPTDPPAEKIEIPVSDSPERDEVVNEPTEREGTRKYPPRPKR